MDQYKYTVGRTTSGDAIKICPLTRKTPNLEEDSYDCYELDCSAISSEKWELLHGHRCHCPVERYFEVQGSSEIYATPEEFLANVGKNHGMIVYMI